MKPCGRPLPFLHDASSRPWRLSEISRPPYLRGAQANKRYLRTLDASGCRSSFYPRICVLVDIQVVAAFTGSLTSLPPFYLVTLACGVLRVPFLLFAVAGLGGTVSRYGLLVWLAAAVRAG